MSMRTWLVSMLEPQPKATPPAPDPVEIPEGMMLFGSTFLVPIPVAQPGWTNRYMAGHSIPIPPKANRYVTPPADAPYFDYSVPFLCPPPEVRKELWDAANVEAVTLAHRMQAQPPAEEARALYERCCYLLEIMAINKD